MIREFKIKDLERVMEIWLESNIDAHSFIDKKYWEDNYEMVKEILPSAEIYLYEENKNILGFVGLLLLIFLISILCIRTTSYLNGRSISVIKSSLEGSGTLKVFERTFLSLFKYASITLLALLSIFT